MPFNIGLPELVIILVIVLLVFGAGRLPQVGNAMGRSIREFKKGMAGDEEEKAAGTAQASTSAEAQPAPGKTETAPAAKKE